MPNPVNFVYAADHAAAREAVAELATASRLAVDLEADSLHSYREKVCLVQASTERGNWILDPLTDDGWFPAFARILEDPSVEKVAHGADYDIRLLKKDRGVSVRNVFDTMIAAQFTGRPRFGLAALLEEFFGIRLDKKHQRADWSARPLAPDLLAYAALDTAYLLPLRDRLTEELEKLGRGAWVEEECRRLEAAEPADTNGPTVWKVKGAHALGPRDLAVLQALLEVRDRYARQWDRPAFKVLSNQTLLDWAARPPRSRAAVLQTEGVGKALLARIADDVVAAVEEALALPPEAWPRRETTAYVPLTEREEARLKRLKRARTRLAKRLGLDPGLLVNSATLERLARLDPAEAPGWLATNLKVWQQEVVGPELLAALSTAG
ncbi:ribonuclease D [Deferrisoma palaeochoriense]